MKKSILSSFSRVTLSIVVIMLFLSSEVFLKGVVFVSCSIVVPVTIYLEGGLESGSITDGTIHITSGMVILDNVVFQVSPVFGGFNKSLNHIITRSGRLNSTGICLEKGYLMRLAGVYITEDKDSSIIHIVFGYGDAYLDSTAISYNCCRPDVLILINATGVLTFSESYVAISAQGSAILPGVMENQREGCLVVIRKEAPIEWGTVDLEMWRSWVMSVSEDEYPHYVEPDGGLVWKDEDQYYIAVPKNGYVAADISLNPNGSLSRLLKKYDLSSSGRIGLLVSCNMQNTSIAYLIASGLKNQLMIYMNSELWEAGVDVERYLDKINYIAILFEQSKNFFEKGDLETGSGFLEKSLIKTANVLNDLRQAKVDFIFMLPFTIVFTFFLSFIVSEMIGKRRKLMRVCFFIMLFLVEIMLIPQIRRTLALLGQISFLLLHMLFNPSFLLTIGMLVTVGVLLFEVKGTLLSDVFWYSIKNMCRRKLRTTLTLATIAVVSIVSGSLLRIGTMTTTRETVYPSEFHGLSISSHVTDVTYYHKENRVLIDEFFEPIPEWQVKWLSSMEGVEKIYVVTASQVFISKEGRIVRTSLIATNVTMLNGIMVSASLAEALGIKEGDFININIGENIVESRVDTILEEPLRLVDGVPLDEVEEPLIVVGLELLQQPLSVYRLVLEGNFSSDFAKRLVEISYEKALNLGVGITTQTFRSFRACFGTGNGTRSLLIVGEFQQFASAPELLVPMGLSSLMILITLLGSFHERQKEYSTISMFGASPGRVSLLMFVEGLSYGLIGGALGYVLSQLQVIVPTPVTLVNPYAFSPLLASFLVAVVPSMVGSIIPARKAILKVVPSRFLFKKVEEFKLFRDHAESVIPLRIIGDTDAFVTYVSSLTKRPLPVNWGPIYMQTSLRKEGNTVKAVEMVLSYRGNRVAMYKITLLLPESPGSMIKAIAYSATGKWGIDHKYCAREMLTALREDLLQYVEWKKLAYNEQTNRASYQQTGLFKNG